MLQKSAKLAIFGWLTVFPPAYFVVYIFFPALQEKCTHFAISWQTIKGNSTFGPKKFLFYLNIKL